MKLVYDLDGTEVCVGDEVQVDKTTRVVVEAIVKPHKPSSTGRVRVRMLEPESEKGAKLEWFPSVIRAKWIDREDQRPPKKLHCLEEGTDMLGMPVDWEKIPASIRADIENYYVENGMTDLVDGEQMTVLQALHGYLMWNGIIGYLSPIANIVRAVDFGNN